MPTALAHWKMFTRPKKFSTVDIYKGGEKERLTKRGKEREEKRKRDRHREREPNRQKQKRGRKKERERERCWKNKAKVDKTLTVITTCNC